MTGLGRLTVKRIDTIQNFYGRAIRDNKGDARAMAKATRAILKHYSSTPENPQHDDCPEGQGSWCSYQRDVSNNTSLHKPIKNPLSPAIVEVLRPTFLRLGNEEFLAGCEKGFTQNANESLHHVIWSFAPKDIYNSTQEINAAISLGVLLFNEGCERTFKGLLPSLDMPDSVPNMTNSWEKIGNERLYLAEYRHSDSTKKRRKFKKRDKLRKDDAFVHQEGTSYQSQAFHGGNSTKKEVRRK